MRRLGSSISRRDSGLRGLGGLLSLVIGGALVAGCGDDTEPFPPTTTTTTTTTADGGSGGAGGGTGGAGGEGAQGGGGSAPSYCTVTAPGATRGSAIAISPDDSIVASVNRDVGTVTIARVDYSDGQPALTKTVELDLGAGSEPWQVAIDGCGEKAYVVLRRDQRLVTIENLDTGPTVGAAVAVGSEPTGLAILPNNTGAYVTSWVDGTATLVDLGDMSVQSTVDLNETLVATGLLGAVAPRPALAHPRAIAITNDGDPDDTDETVYVTEWFAQRTGAETVATADTNKKGLVYKIPVGAATATTIDLPPVMDTGFRDHNDGATGCFPNQIGSITVEGEFAYVTSTCASPKGPIGVFQQAGACATNAQCGAVGGVCNFGTLTCNPNPTDVKTTTHPALSIIRLSDDAATTSPLDQRFADPAVASARMPLLPTDIGFFNGFAYLSAAGSDAVFRIEVADGAIVTVGSQTNDFINLRRPMNDPLIRLPIGVATAHGAGFAFVANEGSRDVTALALSAQAIAGNQVDDFRILQASDLPAANSEEEAQLKGKRFFVTGLGRWSLNGEAWGSCAACHIDGLSDNVTWYFARGPRQSTSLDGSFASADPADQRIFNWTGILDEIADFEGNTRGVSGGVGAIVSATSSPPVNADRINTAAETPPQQGLQGSSNDTANPAGSGPHPHSLLNDWREIEAYIKTIRSPRRPSNVSQVDASAGRTLFTGSGQGNCVGCHSGAKWTISRLFYAPGDVPNAATNSAAPDSLGNINWNTALNGFPAALFPINTPAVDPATSARMRFGAPPGAEQIQCILRPVGTFGTAPGEVGVLELRQDMTTAAQGNADTGRGYNPPSLLGMQVGAPYFHAGNARTLEEVLDDALFSAHHRSAIAQVFTPDDTTKRQLVAFLLSIDEDEPAVAIPPKGATGGDLCFYQ